MQHERGRRVAVFRLYDRRDGVQCIAPPAGIAPLPRVRAIGARQGTDVAYQLGGFGGERIKR